MTTSVPAEIRTGHFSSTDRCYCYASLFGDSLLLMVVGAEGRVLDGRR